MKKLSALALITAIVAVGSTVVPAQAASQQDIAEQIKTNGYAVVGGQVSSPEELEALLANLCGEPEHTDWTNCPIISLPGGGLPDTNTPGTPDTEAPDAGQPDTDSPETDTEAQSYAEQVAALVNAERAKAGLTALRLDKQIGSAALIRAKETETSFSHTRPDGRQFSTALTDMGISFMGAGENIAWGQKSPEEVMNGWMNSEGHRANILNPKFTKIGVGYYQNPAGRNFWTQLFTY